MVMDYIAISALIIAVLSALSKFINESHIRKCHMCCIDSDCRKTKSPPETPITENSKDKETNVSETEI